MNWIRDVLRPKVKTLFGKIKDVPENLWVSCPKCHALLYKADVMKHLNVCQRCGHHLELPVPERFASMFDGGAYLELPLPDVPDDPLDFKDLKKYKDRLAQYRESTGARDAMRAACGTIGGKTAVVGVMDFAFMGGSMGAYVGEAILFAAKEAVRLRAAFVLVTASGGARMQEGICSLMQMARTTLAVNMVRDAGLPYIVIMSNPTYGGVSASFAMLGDIHIVESGAEVGFAGRRVIEQTIKKKLPDEFQRAEFLKTHGVVDMVLARRDIYPKLSVMLRILMHGDSSGKAIEAVSRKAGAARARAEKAGSVVASLAAVAGNIASAAIAAVQPAAKPRGRRKGAKK